MSITYAVYGDQDLWNGYGGGGILPTQVLLLPGCTSTVLHAQVRDGGTVISVDLTGSFSYNALNVSLNDVTGSFTTLAAYKNGALSETKISNIGLDVTKFLFTDYAYELAAYSGDDTFTGSSTNPVDDFIRGGAGNDKFAGFGDLKYNDSFNGEAGIDTAVYFGSYSAYSIAKSSTIWDNIKDDGSRLSGYVITDKVANRDGIDNLVGVERLQFLNTNVALDIGKGETGGEAYRLYKAAFDRAPDAGGLGFWINEMDDGASLTGVAAGFINSPEFQKLYGANVSDRDYVTKLYNNVLDRNPDQGGYDFWLGALSNGATREDILVNFSESRENIANVADLIANGIQYQEWLG